MSNARLDVKFESEKKDMTQEFGEVEVKPGGTFIISGVKMTITLEPTYPWAGKAVSTDITGSIIIRNIGRHHAPD